MAKTSNVTTHLTTQAGSRLTNACLFSAFVFIASALSGCGSSDETLNAGEGNLGGGFSTGSSDGGSSIPPIFAPRNNSDLQGEWTACYNHGLIGDSSDNPAAQTPPAALTRTDQPVSVMALSTQRTLTLSDTDDWEERFEYYAQENCAENPDNTRTGANRRAGTYQFRAETALDNGLMVRPINQFITESDFNSDDLRSTCYSVLAVFGGILLTGSESPFNDCSSPAARHEVIDRQYPLFSETKALALMPSEPLLEGLFTRCDTDVSLTDQNREISERSILTFEAGVSSTLRLRYPDNSCAQSPTLTENFNGFATIARSIGEEDSIKVHDILSAHNPTYLDFPACFQRIGLNETTFFPSKLKEAENEEEEEALHDIDDCSYASLESQVIDRDRPFLRQ